MLKIKKILSAVTLFFTMLVINGCDAVLLNTKGPIAFAEKNILIISVLLMLAIVVPVMVLTLFFAWRYRESNTKATYLPTWDNNIFIEIVCWGIPCIIIAILGTITWKSSHDLDPFKPLQSSVKPITVQAISLQWRWLFVYPEQKIATINYIQIPVGVPVVFNITSEGPMNSFQIPQLGGQIYAMAGMQSKLNLIADEKGVFHGISANFNGEGFSNMKFTARASTKEEFNAWVNSVKQSPNVLTMKAYDQLAKPNMNNNVQYFSSVAGSLFSNIVMKTMMPKTMLCSANNMPTMSNH